MSFIFWRSVSASSLGPTGRPPVLIVGPRSQAGGQRLVSAGPSYIGRGASQAAGIAATRIRRVAVAERRLGHMQRSAADWRSASKGPSSSAATLYPAHGEHCASSVRCRERRVASYALHLYHAPTKGAPDSSYEQAGSVADEDRARCRPIDALSTPPSSVTPSTRAPSSPAGLKVCLGRMNTARRRFKNRHSQVRRVARSQTRRRRTLLLV